MKPISTRDRWTHADRFCSTAHTQSHSKQDSSAHIGKAITIHTLRCRKACSCQTTCSWKDTHTSAKSRSSHQISVRHQSTSLRSWVACHSLNWTSYRWSRTTHSQWNSSRSKAQTIKTNLVTHSITNCLKITWTTRILCHAKTRRKLQSLEVV